MDDILLSFGGAVKALGEGKFLAPAILFGGPDAHDLVKDFFDGRTDYWTEFPAHKPLIYDHGLDKELKSRRLSPGTVELEMKADGVWFQSQLDRADKYEADLYKLIEEGKVGVSTGSASHLVEREPV